MLILIRWQLSILISINYKDRRLLWVNIHKKQHLWLLLKFSDFNLKGYPCRFDKHKKLYIANKTVMKKTSVIETLTFFDDEFDGEKLIERLLFIEKVEKGYRMLRRTV